MTKNDSEKITLISQGLTVVALLAVLPLGLLSALLAGLLVYNIIVFGAERLCRMGVMPSNQTAKITILVFISLCVIALFVIIGLLFASFVSDGPESIVGLMNRLADVVLTSRKAMPEWLQEYLPTNLGVIQTEVHEWLLGNAAYLSVVGRNAGLFIVHLVFGMIIGGMVALHTTEASSKAPLTKALQARATCLSLAFRRVIFSQVRISALNTALTFVFLGVVMPAMGYHLPLIRTMVVVTFIVGLMPIIGNIISNTVIVLISLGVSPFAAGVALVFLILIHKLEYFINARIIGSRISARAWELLMVMLVMDSAFGIAGLVAAPIYYAYIKNELANQGLIEPQTV